MSDENKKHDLLKVENNVPASAGFGSDIFRSASNFTEAWKMAGALAKSQLIPQQFQGKPEDTLIAIEMSQRIGASPFMVLQNLYIVYGKPAWSSQFLIACLNSCGRFSPLHYKMTGEKGKDNYGCIAWAKDLADGEVLESPEVTIGMAKKEGWYGKNGSKWQSMPELMLRYRTATLFARLYAPEITMGMRTDDEVIDIAPVVSESRSSKFEKAMDAAKVDVEVVNDKAAEYTDFDRIADYIKENNVPVTAEQIRDYVTGQGEILIADMVIPNINSIASSILGGEQ